MKTPSHIHKWEAKLTFKCKCGVTHTDPLVIGADGAVYIERTECVVGSPFVSKRTRQEEAALVNGVTS